MRRRRHTLFVVLLLLLATPAHALTVAILEPPSRAPALRETLFRLQGELLAVGLDVAIAERPAGGELQGDGARSRLEQLARERGVDAIIDVVGETSPNAVDVWVFRSTRGSAERKRVTLEPGARNPGETLAIRAIDVLRSSFVEFDLALRRQEQARVRAAEPVPEQEPDRARAEPAALAGLGAGAVAVIGLDRVGPALLPLARLEWATPWPIAAQATLAGFGTQPVIATDVGDVRLAQQFGLLGLSCCRPFDAGFDPFVSLALGALHTSIDGRALPPNDGHERDSWSWLVDGSFGLRLPVFDPYYLTIATHVQLAQPYVAVHAVDSTVATSGRPNVLLSLTVGAWL